MSLRSLESETICVFHCLNPQSLVTYLYVQYLLSEVFVWFVIFFLVPTCSNVNGFDFTFGKPVR